MAMVKAQMGAAAPDPRSRQTRWAWLVATFLGIGAMRPGPGTWASAETTVLWYFAASHMPAEFRTGAALAILVAVCAVGIPASTIVERESGRHDPGFVVIDEVAGQMLALVAVPLGWKTLLVGFILFRVFDVLKPPPLRRLERLGGGAGVMLDDLGAGLYALFVIQALLRLGAL